MQPIPQSETLHYDVANRSWSLVPCCGSVPVRRADLVPIPDTQRQRLGRLAAAFDLEWAPLLVGGVSPQEVWAATGGSTPPFSSTYTSPSRHLSWEVLPDGTVVVEVRAAPEDLVHARRLAASALVSDDPVVGRTASDLVDQVLVLEQLEEPRPVLRLAVNPAGAVLVLYWAAAAGPRHLDAADSVLRVLGCPELPRAVALRRAS